ncbi:hypothetical protein JA9_004551 [Meyerozyma sp. JA9]|nr:hypothetical protein JA9_004551 [Meyerozyma sp. JA9]
MVPHNIAGPRLSHVLVRTAARKPRHSPFLTRFVSTNEENERLKYDQARNDIILSTIKSRPDLLVNAGLQRKSSMSWKSILLGMALTSTATMGLFVSLQLMYPRSDPDAPRRAFVPLWLSTGWSGKTSYKFPRDVILLDENCYHCLVDGRELPEYLDHLEKENIKYKVLELLSSSQEARKTLKLPVSISVPEISDFKVWMESTMPTVSGLQFSFAPNELFPTVEWQLKQIDYRSVADSALVAAGLKLDRLGSDAEKKTHEKSSGKIHESVPEHERHVHTPKNYTIKMSGIMDFEDKCHRKGTVNYSAVLDFDHLKINGGVKITSMYLVVDNKHYHVK